MASLMLSATIAAIPMGSMNIFSNATAQGYNENYYEDEKYNKYPTNDYKYECQKGPFEGFFVSSVEFCDAKLFDDDEKKKDRHMAKPEPVKNPILTVKKEMFICETPNTPPGTDEINCIEPSGTTIPGPDRTDYWISWDDCTVTNFCQFFDEADFLMQIEQNSGPNFIRFEFPGNSDGRSVIVESGTFQVTEEVDPESHHCEFTNNEDGYEDGTVHIVHDPKGSGLPEASFCIFLEDDCSGTIQSGEEKTCTVKNYFFIGRLPPTGNGVNDATTGITTQSNNAITTQSNNAITTQSNNAITTQSNNAITTQSNNAITTQSNNAITTTPITTQSSNVGAALQSNDVGSTTTQSSNVGSTTTQSSNVGSTTTQSSNVGSTTTQSSNVAGVPNTFSSSFSPPSSPLNIFP